MPSVKWYGRKARSMILTLCYRLDLDMTRARILNSSDSPRLGVLHDMASFPTSKISNESPKITSHSAASPKGLGMHGIAWCLDRHMMKIDFIGSMSIAAAILRLWTTFPPWRSSESARINSMELTKLFRELLVTWLLLHFTSKPYRFLLVSK